MAFRDTNKIDLLKSILRFYQERFALPPDCVFPVAHPLNPGRPFPMGGTVFLGINMGDGQFPLEEQDDEQLRETCEFQAMAYTRMQRDWGGRDDEFYLNAESGALALQQKLLQIVGAQLKDEAGTGIIASRVFALSTVAPSYDQQQGIGWTGIRFGVEFDWDMAGAEDFGDD